MPSRSIVGVAELWMKCVHSRLYMFSSRCASTSATLSPSRARKVAAVHPAMLAPTTMTSYRSMPGVCRKLSGSRRDSHRQVTSVTAAVAERPLLAAGPSLGHPEAGERIEGVVDRHAGRHPFQHRQHIAAP